MRYEKGHKEATRRRILGVAAAEFREKGINGVGVADLMKDAGLTHGGFYSHFSSKEDLVRQVIEEAFSESRLKYPCAGEGPKNIEGLIRRYLRPEHRDHPELGCLATTLTGELARQPEAVRAEFTAKVGEMLAVIESHLPAKKSPAALRKTAMGIFSTMAGAMQLARAINDPKQSDALLEAGIEAACALAKN